MNRRGFFSFLAGLGSTTALIKWAEENPTNVPRDAHHLTCGKCGWEEYDLEARYCKHCGARLDLLEYETFKEEPFEPAVLDAPDGVWVQEFLKPGKRLWKLKHAPEDGSLQLYLNGILLHPEFDYKQTNVFVAFDKSMFTSQDGWGEDQIAHWRNTEVVIARYWRKAEA